jgi:hypothetical protein
VYRKALCTLILKMTFWRHRTLKICWARKIAQVTCKICDTNA